MTSRALRAGPNKKWRRCINTRTLHGSSSRSELCEANFGQTFGRRRFRTSGRRLHEVFLTESAPGAHPRLVGCGGAHASTAPTGSSAGLGGRERSSRIVASRRRRMPILGSDRHSWGLSGGQMKQCMIQLCAELIRGSAHVRTQVGRNFEVKFHAPADQIRPRSATCFPCRTELSQRWPDAGQTWPHSVGFGRTRPMLTDFGPMLVNFRQDVPNTCPKVDRVSQVRSLLAKVGPKSDKARPHRPGVVKHGQPSQDVLRSPQSNNSSFQSC